MTKTAQCHARAWGWQTSRALKFAWRHALSLGIVGENRLQGTRFSDVTQEGRQGKNKDPRSSEQEQDGHSEARDTCQGGVQRLLTRWNWYSDACSGPVDLVQESPEQSTESEVDDLDDLHCALASASNPAAASIRPDIHATTESLLVSSHPAVHRWAAWMVKICFHEWRQRALQRRQEALRLPEALHHRLKLGLSTVADRSTGQSLDAQDALNWLDQERAWRGDMLLKRVRAGSDHLIEHKRATQSQQPVARSVHFPSRPLALGASVLCHGIMDD